MASVLTRQSGVLPGLQGPSPRGSSARGPSEARGTIATSFWLALAINLDDELNFHRHSHPRARFAWRRPNVSGESSLLCRSQYELALNSAAVDENQTGRPRAYAVERGGKGPIMLHQPMSCRHPECAQCTMELLGSIAWLECGKADGTNQDVRMQIGVSLIWIKHTYSDWSKRSVVAGHPSHPCGPQFSLVTCPLT